MFKYLFVYLIFALLTFNAEAQHTVEGKVIDDETGHEMVSATIQILEINRITVTNRNGLFTFKNVPEGTYTIRVSFVGHKTVQRTVNVPGDVTEVMQFVLEEQPFEPEEIIVTASPIQTTIQYQPAQALHSLDLQRKGASSIGEMLDGEPGVSMRYFGPATSRPVIRGFDGERVLVLNNGERMGDLAETSADHGIAIEPLSTDRVEIVRGPATMLYGTNALGGVVNIFSNEIPRRWAPGLSGNLSLQALSMNASGAGLANVTYGMDDWAFTGRFSYREAGSVRTPAQRIPSTFIENLTAGFGAGFNKGNIKGGASFNFTDQTYGIPEELDDPDEEIEVQLNRENIQAYLEWNNDGFIRNIEWRFSGTRFNQKEVEFEFEDGVLDDIELGLDFRQHNVSSTVTFKHKP
ncbi:MAG: TonB-dependent receptor plug domain-containing protein, partial [Balneolaceae bacterium]